MNNLKSAQLLFILNTVSGYTRYYYVAAFRIIKDKESQAEWNDESFEIYAHEILYRIARQYVKFEALQNAINSEVRYK